MNTIKQTQLRNIKTNEKLNFFYVFNKYGIFEKIDVNQNSKQNINGGIIKDTDSPKYKITLIISGEAYFHDDFFKELTNENTFYLELMQKFFTDIQHATNLDNETLEVLHCNQNNNTENVTDLNQSHSQMQQDNNINRDKTYLINTQKPTKLEYINIFQGDVKMNAKIEQIDKDGKKYKVTFDENITEVNSLKCAYNPVLKVRVVNSNILSNDGYEGYEKRIEFIEV